MMQYAAEGAEIARQQTLAITPNFYPETSDHPMTMYDSFSRFAIAIIGDGSTDSNTYRSGPKPSVTCNLTTKKMPDILARTAALLDENDREGNKSSNPAAGPSLSPAYTVTIKGGSPAIRGKTPAEAYAQTPADDNSRVKLSSMFREQLSYLEANTVAGSRFERSNKQQMQALRDALNLMDNRKFDAGKVVQKKFQVCDEMTAGPNELRDQDGKPIGLYKYTRLVISVEMGEKTPVVVTITNGKIRKDDKGDWSLDGMQDKKMLTMRIYPYEWRYLDAQIRSMMLCFETTYYPMAKKLAIREQLANAATQWKMMQSLKRQFAAMLYSDAQASCTFYNKIYTSVFGVNPDRKRVLVRRQDIVDMCPLYDKKLFDAVIYELRNENVGIAYFSPGYFNDKQPTVKADFVVNLDVLGKYLDK